MIRIITHTGLLLISLLLNVSFELKAEDLSILQEADHFDIGPALTPSGQSMEHEALNKILTSEYPSAQLLQIFKVGTISGKLYALCGLHRLNEQNFHTFAKKIPSQKTKILEGCVPKYIHTSEVLENITTGKYLECIATGHDEKIK